MTMHVETVIVGAGQAGLSTSYHLTQAGSPHLVFERSDRVAPVWRDERWDSFTLVTPNWACRLPGAPCAGTDPEGFLRRDEVVAMFEDYARRFALPLRFGTEVTEVATTGDAAGARFRLETSAGRCTARNVVIATGLFQRPRRPAASKRLGSGVLQLDAGAYRHPQALPPGAVLVVGSGQSGCQIADELRRSGRSVFLSTGSAGRVPRRYRGKDSAEWARLLGLYDRTVDLLPSPFLKFAANPHMAGKSEGGDLNLHRFARDGIVLLGRLQGIDHQVVNFKPDLHEHLARADRFESDFTRMVDLFIAQGGLPQPIEALPQLRDGFDLPLVERLDLASAGVTTVIWATGHDFDFSWVRFPVFDADGYPVQRRGVTAQPGLYFIGLPWLHTHKSGLLSGVGDDAAHVVERLLAEDKGTPRHGQ